MSLKSDFEMKNAQNKCLKSGTISSSRPVTVSIGNLSTSSLRSSLSYRRMKDQLEDSRHSLALWKGSPGRLLEEEERMTRVGDNGDLMIRGISAFSLPRSLCG